jgi:hypothetical protein
MTILSPASLYCIPSHRVVPAENLSGFIAEAAFGNAYAKQAIPFVFFDDWSGDENRRALQVAMTRAPELSVFYFPQATVNLLLAAVRPELSPAAREATAQLVLKPELNYGNTLNKMFLTALLFGVETLHRRDMDVLMPVHELTGQTLYPIERELAALGREIAGEVAFIAGGGYRGKFNLDIEPFAADKDFASLKRLFSLMSIPERNHDGIIQKEYLACNEPLIEDRVEHNTGLYPECGNFSLYRLFKYAPCPTLPLALGTDYFVTEAAVHSNLSVTYHYRAVQHRHTACRYDSFQKSESYWRGLALLIDLQVMYRAFFETFIEPEPVTTPGTEFGLNLAAKMRLQLPDFLSSGAERRRKFLGFLDLLSSSSIPSVPAIVELLRRDESDLFASVERGIAEHIALLEAWPEVVSSAAKIRESAKVRELLLASCLQRGAISSP